MLGYPTDAVNKTYPEMYGEFLLLNFHVNFLIYWMAISIQSLIAFYDEYRERELRSAHLETQLAQARLAVLKNQLQPHFLFNTLNSVTELIYENQKDAELMVANLSDLLRMSLDKMHIQEVPLRQELEFLRKYLEIEKVRFEERLQVKLDIAPDTLESAVPNMILQPLVENSIRHGIAPLADGGRVDISAERRNGALRIRVADNGTGLTKKGHAEGVGLSNTRARLEQLYGAKYLFEITELERGLEVSMQIPFRTEMSGHED
jgi:LytS/YehU family sensor histidine kinase